MEDDLKLLHRISRGDRDALSDFYDQHSTRLFHIAHLILNDKPAAEDVLLKVFLQIWEQAGDYDPSFGKPANWAATLTRTKSIDCLRANEHAYRFLKRTARATLVQGCWRTAIKESFRSRKG